ncbi:MAG: DMT family transporter, partial [Myxococcota bacterium]|nr:DMT family transporter [Myxococcota bacterium]
RRRRDLIFLVLAGVSYAVDFGGWVCSLSLTSVAASVSLVTCTPLLLALVGWISGQERLSWTSFSSLGLACLGIFIMGIDQPSGVGLGEGLALLGAAAMAAYLLCARRLRGELSPLALTGSSALIAASILWSTAYLLNQPLMIEEAAIMPLIGTTLIPQLIGHSLLTWGLQFVQPTMVAFFTLAEPPLASLFTWIAFSERPSWEVFLGGGIVLFSVWRSQSELAQVQM